MSDFDQAAESSAPEDAAALDEDEGRDALDLEAAGEVGPVVDVDPRDAKTRPLFAREVREQALHPPCGPGALGPKEDEQRPGVVRHGSSPCEVVEPGETPERSDLSMPARARRQTGARLPPRG